MDCFLKLYLFIYNSRMKILSWDVGQKNLAVCLFEDDNIIDWRVIDLTSNIKTKIKTRDLTQLSQILIEILSKEPKWLETDIILIENQPTKNPIMKTIQMIIFTYYQLKKFKKEFNGDIKLFNPRIKLSKQTDCPSMEELNYKRTNKDDYGHRKKLSITMTKYYLQKNKSNWIEVWTSSKKKDDLSDCYLQARAYWLNNQKNKIKSTDIKINITDTTTPDEIII